LAGRSRIIRLEYAAVHWIKDDIKNKRQKDPSSTFPDQSPTIDNLLAPLVFHLEEEGWASTKLM